MGNDIVPNPDDTIINYVNKIIEYNYKNDINNHINDIRSKICKYFPIYKCDIIWNKEILNYLHEYVIYNNKLLYFVNSSSNDKIINLSRKRKIHDYNNENIKYIKLEDNYQKNFKELKNNYVKYIKYKSIFLENNRLLSIIDYHLKIIVSESINIFSMTKSLLIYMFPNLFKDDQLHLFYRCDKTNNYNNNDIKILSPKKIMFIRVLINKKFNINENDWLMIKKYIDSICETSTSTSKIILGKYPHFKLKKPENILPGYESDSINILRDIVIKSVSLVDLTEKLIQLAFKDNTYSNYKYFKTPNYFKFDTEKLMQLNYQIKLATDSSDHLMVLNACMETINNYFKEPKHIIGKNLKYCIDIASGKII
nr:E5 protein [Wadden Sea poxvirus]